MAFDYLDETKKIISRLRSENATEQAEKVQDALKSAFTSTELLMGVRFHLAKIPAGTVSAATMSQIQDLIREIDSILQR